MANLSVTDKLKLERLLGMGSGYVLDFSNRTFQEFVADSVGIDIYDEKYNYDSGSKANRLRAFWNRESNSIVAKLLKDLHDYWEFQEVPEGQWIDQELINVSQQYLSVVDRVKNEQDIEDQNTFEQFAEIKDFEHLSKSIIYYLSQNKPELALDRVHTFIRRYLRKLGEKYVYEHGDDIPLHSLMGSYIKALKANNSDLSEMSLRILKSSISLLESFNDIRNNKSYAHDNEVLDNAESKLIVGNVSNLIRFIQLLEDEHDKSSEIINDFANDFDDDIPF